MSWNRVDFTRRCRLPSLLSSASPFQLLYHLHAPVHALQFVHRARPASSSSSSLPLLAQRAPSFPFPPARAPSWPRSSWRPRCHRFPYAAHPPSALHNSLHRDTMKATPLIINWHDQNAPIYSAHFEPSGRGRLATAGGDNHVRIWEVEADGPERKVEYLSTLSKHNQAVNVVRWAPKGIGPFILRTAAMATSFPLRRGSRFSG